MIFHQFGRVSLILTAPNWSPQSAGVDVSTEEGGSDFPLRAGDTLTYILHYHKSALLTCVQLGVCEGLHLLILSVSV